MYSRKILTASLAYIADHLLDWKLYTDASTYKYNCQPHPPTRVATFELVLSNQTGLTSPKPIFSREEPKSEFKHKWKNLIRDTMKKTKERLEKV